MDTLKSLQTEMLQLKRDLKRQRWTSISLLVFGLLGAGALNARTQNIVPSTVPQDLVVKSLVIVGPDGTERITLKADEYYGAIRIVNQHKEPQLVLRSGVFGGMAIISDSTGRPSGAFHAGDGGGALALFAQSKERKKSVFTAVAIEAEEQNSSLQIYDYRGNSLAEIPGK